MGPLWDRHGMLLGPLWDHYGPPVKVKIHPGRPVATPPPDRPEIMILMTSDGHSVRKMISEKF